MSGRTSELKVLLVVAFVAALLPVGGRAEALTYTQLAPKPVLASVALRPGHGGAVAATCPRGFTLLSGGAYVHEKGQPGNPALAAQLHLSGSYPAGRSWHAVAYNDAGPADARLTVEALCTKAKIQLFRVTESFDIAPGGTPLVNAMCPGPSEDPVTAGMSWHRSGQAPSSGLAAKTNIALLDPGPSFGSEWSAGGSNGTAATLVLTMTMLCTTSFTGFMSYPYNLSMQSSGQTAGGIADCGSGFSVIATGAEFTNFSGVVHTGVSLASVGLLSTGDGSFGAGLNSSAGNTSFFAQAFCLNA